ncbi:beta-lactamase family protein [Dipodascopsis uninucleata]
MATLSAQTVSTLKALTEESCSDSITGIPGTTVVVVSKDGELFAHAAGKRGVSSDEPMTLENIYWIASCTKMIVGIACMQLVEQGILVLDDADQVEKLAPELKAVKVLEEDGTLVEKRNRITLRMLLTHTAGFGYTFFNSKLRDYSKPIGYDEFSGHIYDMMQPLVHHPGESWEYGINIDWAGVLLERATKLSLNDYLQENVFKPLGIKNISMFPNEEMKSKLAHMNYRNSNGEMEPNDHLLRRPLIIESSEVKSCFNSGGAGCFAKPQEYGRIISTLLNDGTSPATGAQILKKSTVDEMFRNQIPNFPNFGRKGIPDAKPELTNAIPDVYPLSGNAPQGWGLTFMLTGGATGRSSGTGQWAGLANLWWWCDREKGVGGFICSQVLPFVDAKVIGLWVDIESTVYKAIGK